MGLINIGFSNMINESRVIGMVSPEAAPIKRLVQEAKKKNLLIDATSGRKTKSAIVMDSGHIILSSLQCDTLSIRMNNNKGDNQIEQK